jgi:cytochrome c553
VRPEPAAALAAACSGCHAPAETDAIPSLEGWSAEALAASLTALKAYAGGSTVMHRLARGYSDEEIATIAGYLGEEAPP